MEMKIFETLANWVRKHAVIKCNDEEVFVTVDFPHSIAEWHEPRELASFVAKVFPLDWIFIDDSPKKGGYRVSLGWCAEKSGAVEDRQDEYGLPDDEELHLDEKGRKRLAGWVKRMVTQYPVEESTFDMMLGSPAKQGLDFWLAIPTNFFFLFGKKALINLILEQYPGWNFRELRLAYGEEMSAVFLMKTTPIKVAV